MREAWIEFRMLVATTLLEWAAKVAPIEHPHGRVLNESVALYLRRVLSDFKDGTDA